ncbi:nucleoside deaminase [Alphaproteobacteria bacterium]|jgi:tRNA(adenine34) deaminase|nr:nucleoside deaminase [Alphaproteobacteria bacterium]MDA9816313.1 nucleoside deaminase [Alphaproteobacteria bacterium]MDC3311196.1 nucleoside deaminase [Alphaproteobacteria bacterium]
MQDKDYMKLALQQAQKAAELGEVPVGAVVVDANGDVIAAAHNRVETDQDATAHAECLVLRQAMQVKGQKFLEKCDLWVTLEPCAMCAGAISHARLRRLYYAAEDKKGGAVEHGSRVFSQKTCHHKPEIYGGISASKAADLLTLFFVDKR